MTRAQNKILVPLLTGFEELEAITIIDVLRRAEIPVVTASTKIGPVIGAHGIAISAEEALSNVKTSELQMIVLPGGMPGARHLAEDSHVQRLLKEAAAQDLYLAAICAAPMALAAAGLLRGKKATCYPGFQKDLGDATFVEEAVVIDGKVVTSRGPGTAMQFALTLVELARDKAAAAEVGKRLLLAA